MPKPLSAQSLRGEVRFELDAMHEDLVTIADTVFEMDKAWEHARAKILRRASWANRRRNQALDADRAATEREQFAQTGLAVV